MNSKRVSLAIYLYGSERRLKTLRAVPAFLITAMLLNSTKNYVAADECPFDGSRCPFGGARATNNQSADAEANKTASETKTPINTLKSDDDWVKRRNAAVQLAEQGVGVPVEAIEPLGAAILQDKVEVVRAAAVDALLFHNGGTAGDTALSLDDTR